MHFNSAIIAVFAATSAVAGPISARQRGGPNGDVAAEGFRGGDRLGFGGGGQRGPSNGDGFPGQDDAPEQGDVPEEGDVPGEDEEQQNGDNQGDENADIGNDNGDNQQEGDADAGNDAGNDVGNDVGNDIGDDQENGDDQQEDDADVDNGNDNDNDDENVDDNNDGDNNDNGGGQDGAANTAFIPEDFGVERGVEGDNGECVNAGGAAIPCECPPDSDDPRLIEGINIALTTGAFPEDSNAVVSMNLEEWNADDDSAETQARRAGVMIIVMQSVSGEFGIGCPAAALPVLSEQAQGGA